MKSVNYNNELVYPSKIVCIGKNYVEHIAELNDVASEQPIIFIKPNSALSDRLYFCHEDSVDYEAEISFLVRNGQYVAVAFGLDLTKRQVQNQLKQSGLPWERAKAFDRSAVFSQFVPFECTVANLRLELWINEELRQYANYELMLTKPLALRDEIQSFISLADNDIVMTGTPKGVAPIQLGDIFVGRIFDNDKLLVEQTWTVE